VFGSKTLRTSETKEETLLPTVPDRITNDFGPEVAEEVELFGPFKCVLVFLFCAERREGKKRG